MRRNLCLVAAFALAVLPSCRPDTVDLNYRFDEGAEFVYRLHADAQASWDIGGSGGGTYAVTFEVRERVESTDPTGAVVSVEMTPREVREEGLPAPGSEPRSFEIRVGQDGEVLEVVEVDGVPAASLDTDELAFINTYRPKLPVDRVRIADTWESQQEVRLGSLFQEIVTVGSLEGLDEDAKGAVAEIGYTGDGPLAWSTTLPQGEADLRGTGATTGDAVLDLSGGFLRSAASTTTGTFDVRVAAADGSAPLTGTLELDLRLTLERIS